MKIYNSRILNDLALLKHARWGEALPANSLLTVLCAAGKFGEKVGLIRDQVGYFNPLGNLFIYPMFVPTPIFDERVSPSFRAEFGMELIYRVQSAKPLPNDLFGKYSLETPGFSEEFNAMIRDSPDAAWADDLHEAGVIALLWGVDEYAGQVRQNSPPDFKIMRVSKRLALLLGVDEKELRLPKPRKYRLSRADKRLLHDCLTTFVEVHSQLFTHRVQPD